MEKGGRRGEEEGTEKGELLGAEGGTKMKAQRSLSFFKGIPLMLTLSLRKGFCCHCLLFTYLLTFLFIYVILKSDG